MNPRSEGTTTDLTDGVSSLLQTRRSLSDLAKELAALNDNVPFSWLLKNSLKRYHDAGKEAMQSWEKINELSCKQARVNSRGLEYHCTNCCTPNFVRYSFPVTKLSKNYIKGANDMTKLTKEPKYNKNRNVEKRETFSNKKRVFHE